MKLATIAALAKALGGGSSGGGGGGGDNGFFDITIIDWESPAIDKTYAEICAAKNAGKTIRVIEAGNALFATASEGSSTQLGNFVSVYPLWIDVSVEDPIQIDINTTEITVLESGSVTVAHDASFTISGTPMSDT